LGRHSNGPINVSFTIIFYRGRKGDVTPPAVLGERFSGGSPVASSRLLRTERHSGGATAASVAAPLVALCNQALACHRAGRIAEAITHYEQILALRPDLPEIHNNLGHALAALGKPDAAVAAYRRAVELKPHNPEALCNWGLALAELEQLDEAEAKYRRAIAVNPQFAGAYNNLGLLLKERGRLTEARRAFEQAIRLAPRDASYYDNLAAVRPFVAGDPNLMALEALAKNSAALSTVERVHLHFGLAKAYEGLGRSESAFRQLLTANKLMRQQITYDEAATLGRMDRLRELIGRDFIQARQGGGEPSALPVFIVGMPRSGTTLIEQILASHPQINGAGEIQLFDQAAGSIREVLPGVPQFPEMMLGMSAKHFRALGARYLDRLANRAPGALRITDKMTANFLFAGLIHLALPNATIIHAVRDAIDTCVSCFSVHFTKGLTYTYDLAELGRYYRRYRAMMAHWHDVLPPGRIIDVHYEELVGDLEGVARRLIAHCGLGWDDRCLDFHRTERPVRTASATQVRQPIYQTSVGRWRKFEKFLGPLFAELETPNVSIGHGLGVAGAGARRILTRPLTVSNLTEDMHV
jgi:tetratricopeptide (TPR) repeat protein